MYLYLSGRSPLNTILTNADGQVLYKVETPFSFGSRTSSVTRVIPNDISGNEEDDPSMQDRFEYFGEVEHNPISSSVLRFGGNQFEVNTFFRKAEWAPNGRSRIFTGTDGREYKWLLQRYTPKDIDLTLNQLITNDETKTVVAQFHRKNLGILGKARPASLEILETGDHMLQEILMTFLYVEKIRKDRERAG